MVGLVIVSHSAKLAEGVAELAREMGGPELVIATAGGTALPDAPLGTDATMVADAIREAHSDAGVVVLMDLGSAVLSAQMALDMVPDDVRGNVILCSAPLVEGAVAAATAARAGLDARAVASEATGALGPKAEQIGDAPGSWRGALVEDGAESIELDVTNPLGLHARPAARLVQAAAAFDARVSVTNLTTGTGPASARSLNDIAALGVRQGHRIRVAASGPQAREGLRALADLAAAGFGDGPGDGSPPASERARPAPGATFTGVPASPGVGRGPARVCDPSPANPPEARATDPEREAARLLEAIDAVARELEELRNSVGARLGDEAAAIFEAQELLMRDEAILGTAGNAIREQAVSAERAYLGAACDAAARFAALDDPYLAARGNDVVEIGERVAARLAGREWGVRAVATGVLVTARLPAASAALLDPDTVAGVVEASGLPETHSSILLRAAGIPAVVGVGDAVLAVEEGTDVVVDGDRGAVFVDPDAEVLASYAAGGKGPS